MTAWLTTAVPGSGDRDQHRVAELGRRSVYSHSDCSFWNVIGPKIATAGAGPFSNTPGLRKAAVVM